MDFQYFDRHVARFDSGSGQLFWANAYYLRREVAYPEAEAGWQSLVRDACITGALGFHDLTGLALGLAERSAPAGQGWDDQGRLVGGPGRRLAGAQAR